MIIIASKQQLKISASVLGSCDFSNECYHYFFSSFVLHLLMLQNKSGEVSIWKKSISTLTVITVRKAEDETATEGEVSCLKHPAN